MLGVWDRDEGDVPRLVPGDLSAAAQFIARAHVTIFRRLSACGPSEIAVFKRGLTRSSGQYYVC